MDQGAVESQGQRHAKPSWRSPDQHDRFRVAHLKTSFPYFPSNSAHPQPSAACTRASVVSGTLISPASTFWMLRGFRSILFCSWQR